MCLFKRKIKPVAEGYLPEEDGHKVYWARYGNVQGKTVLIFSGGPGSYSKPHHVQMVNLKKYNVILFDQRGNGKSEPIGKLEDNNTQKLISDAKRILDFHGIKKAVIQGGSWGSCLALLFCEKYPKIADKIVLTDIFLAKKSDNAWLFEGTKIMYPDAYEKMVKLKPKNKSLAGYYYGLITSNKQSDVKKAMDGFSNYERSVGELEVDIRAEANYKKTNSKRIFLHYMKDNYFVKDGEILNKIKAIANKPCLIIHNRLDLLCPLEGAWNLHKEMKKSKLIIKPALGHGVNFDKTTKKEIAEFLDK